MKDFRILLKNLRPYAGLFALAFALTACVGLFEAARTALLKSIIDGLPGTGISANRPVNSGALGGSAKPTSNAAPDSTTSTSGASASNVSSTPAMSAAPATPSNATYPATSITKGIAARVDVRNYIPAGKNPWTIIAGLLVIFTLIRGLSEYLSSVLMWRIGVSVVVNLREKLYNHILKQSAEFFSRYPTNSLTSHIISDAKEVQVAVSTLLADLLREGLTFIALFALVLVYNWRLTLLALGMGPLIYVLTVRFGKKLRRIANTTQEGMEEVLDIAQETISGNRIVKAFGMEKFEQRRFGGALSRLGGTQIRAAYVVYLSSPILELVGVIIAAVFLLYARHAIAVGSMTVGMFAAYIVAIIQMYDPLRKMSRIQNYFQQSFAASARIQTLLDHHTEKRDLPGAVSMPLFKDKIEFRDVSFKYEDSEDWVLKNVSVSARRGQVVALVGLSGAGKTTLTNLLMRFYDPGRGQVLIDGRDISTVQLDSLRAQMALVTQDVILFNDSITDNIAYGRPDVDSEMIESAAKNAYAHDFIVDRGGYDTVIGERGVKLSGGERQRL
ncbi:MAG TPA: ABC transporter transmembrane domain-containing protein, partial [Blastocatellia bacterium]|nr:ABC transporter transmembrane domain-containing protein [Blastocatellia bacterium]